MLDSTSDQILELPEYDVFAKLSLSHTFLFYLQKDIQQVLPQHIDDMFGIGSWPSML